MVKDFLYFNAPFSEYKKRVDAFFVEKSGGYSELLESFSDGAAADFYKSLFYIINNFLEDGGDNSQLFIQLPCEELGHKENEQERNLSKLQHLVSEALFLSTSKKLEAIKAPASLQDCELNSLYCMGTGVLNPNNNSKRERVWQVCETRDKTKKCLREQLPDNQHFRLSQSEQAYEDNRNNTFKLKGGVILPSNTSQRKSAFLKKVASIAEKLSLYQKYGNKKQYSNALIVCFDDNWDDTLVNSTLVDSPVTARRRYDIDEENNYDVVIFIGDRKYMCLEDRIQENLAYGIWSKVIYIGSEIFDGFDNRYGTLKYAYSFREIYSYFFNGQTVGKECYFPDIRIHSLEFPWLNEAVEKLNSKLIECGLSSDEISNVLSYAIYPFLGADVNVDVSNNAENLKDFIYENINMTYEDVESFISLYMQLDYPSTNPKQKIKKDLEARHSLDCKLFVANHKSYKDSIKEFIRNKNHFNNRILVDVKGDWRAYVDILKYLLKHGAAGHYYFLSYCKMDMLEKFIKSELEVYQDKYRETILSGISIDIDKPETSSVVDGDLSSFYKPMEIDDYFANTGTAARKSPRFSFTDKEGNKVPVTGDVIIESAIVPLMTIFGNKEDYLPAEVTYYANPDNFKYLMKLKYSFPADRDVDYYANLWKNVLEEYCKNRYNGKFKEMEKADFPYLKNLKTYWGGRSATSFPRQINPLVRKLMSLNLISSEDARFILAADRVNRLYSSNGVELKDALYRYKLTGAKKRILEDIENAASINGDNITAETIAESALVTVSVKDIEKD